MLNTKQEEHMLEAGREDGYCECGNRMNKITDDEQDVCGDCR